MVVGSGVSFTFGILVKLVITPIHESSAFRCSYFTFICSYLHFLLSDERCMHKYKCQNNKRVHANV